MTGAMKYTVFEGSEIAGALYDPEIRGGDLFFAWKDEGGRELGAPVLIKSGVDCDGTHGYSVHDANDIARRLGYSNGEFASRANTKFFSDGTVSPLYLVAWGECTEGELP